MSRVTAVIRQIATLGARACRRLVPRSGSSSPQFACDKTRAVGWWRGTRSLGRYVEPTAAATAVLAAAVPLARLAVAMATTSLFGDELYSILMFSGHGPWWAATQYPKPNNHILFNVVNALTPGSGSFDPLRARLWSFVAVAVALVTIGIFFARRNRWLEGAALVVILSLDTGLMDLAFQARGYSFTLLATVGLVLGAARFLEAHRRTPLMVAAVSAWLGTWTVPNFVLFAATFLLLLWTVERRLPVAAAGLAAGVVIMLVHLPVAREMLVVMQTYRERWAPEFTSPAAITRVVQLYLVPGPPGLAVAILVAALMGPFLGKRANAIQRVARLGVTAAAAFLLGCLAMKTPQLRTAAFVAFLLALSLVSMAASFVGRLRAPAAVVLAAVSIGVSAYKVRTFAFVPIDNWLGAAVFVRQTFPAGTGVFVRGEAYLLRCYLPSSEFPSWPRLDHVAFAAGRLIVIDAHTGTRFKARSVASEGVDHDLVQRRGGGFIRVSYVPPAPRSGARRDVPPGAVERVRALHGLGEETARQTRRVYEEVLGCA